MLHHHNQVPTMDSGKNNSARIWLLKWELDRWSQAFPLGSFLGPPDPLTLVDPWQLEIDERNQSGAAGSNWNMICGGASSQGPPEVDQSWNNSKQFSGSCGCRSYNCNAKGQTWYATMPRISSARVTGVLSTANAIEFVATTATVRS